MLSPALLTLCLHLALESSNGDERVQTVTNSTSNKRPKRQFDTYGNCPSGEAPYYAMGGFTPTMCPSGSGCPLGYICRITTTQQYLCCGYTGSCPAGMTVYRDATGRERTCSSLSVCPPPAVCQSSTGGPPGQYLCCNVGGSFGSFGNNVGISNAVTIAQCPSGLQPYTISGVPQTCVPGVIGSCYSGYTCMQAVASNNLGLTGSYVCCSGGTAAVIQPVTTMVGTCPTNYSPFYESGRPKNCNFQSDCMQPYTCMLSANNAGNICCRSNTVISNVVTTPICSSGQLLYTNGAVERCVSLGNLCSNSAYSCQMASNTGESVCCSSTSSFSSNTGSSLMVRCSSNRQMYMAGSMPYYCSPSNSACPEAGYACEQSTDPARFVCCYTGLNSALRCASGSAPWMDNGIPRNCQFGLTSTCTPGYTCQSSTLSNSYICCADTAGTCPNLGTIHPSLTTCSIGSLNACPANYQCLQLNNGFPRCCSISSTVSGVSTFGSNVFGALCPNGGTILSTISQCIINDFLSCPTDYVCSLLSTGVQRCCSRTAGSGTACPNGGFLHSTYQTCNLNMQSTCPTGYQCLQTFAGTGLCCSSNQGSCTNGGLAHPSVFTCTFGAVATCPTGYTCTLSTTGVAVCCSGGGIGTELCPNGGIVNVNFAICTSINSCPAGFVCLSTSAGVLRCCSSASSVFGSTFGSYPVCPNQGTVQYVGGTPRYCSSSADCQLGGTCVTSINVGAPVCCQGNNGFFINVASNGSWGFGING